MTEPLVSVLMTAYNREKYIGAAMESVLASTYRNLELIIVDDRSKDRTVEIAKSCAEKDKRVRVYVNEKNLGDYPNRNQAAAYADGKYLKYVDADDYIYPWGLELLVRMMEQYPQAGWGLCSLSQVDEKPYPILLTGRQAYEYHYLYKTKAIFNKAPLSAILRRDAFLEAGGFSSMRMVGDFEMWHRMALHFPVLLMPDGIVWYRKHAEQEMKSHHQFVHKYDEVMLQYLKHDRCPFSAEEVSTVIRNHRRSLLRSAVRDLGRIDLSGTVRHLKARAVFK